MKKLFTLLVVLFAAVTYANAGDWTKSWNISDLDVQDITETKDFNGLTVVAKADTVISIDENSKTADGISFTKRLKLGGVGSPTVRHLKFDVAGPAKIKIFRLSSSSSSDRKLAVAAGSFDNVIAQLDAHGKPATTLDYDSLEYTGEATTIYLYSPKEPGGGVNIYGIFVEEKTGPAPVKPEVWRASEITTNKDALAAMDSVINFSTANVSMKWVSSPYIDAIKEGKSPWSFKCNVKNNMAISDNDTVCIIGIGNPAIECREWWEWDADKQKDVAKKEETYFLPGCGKLPMRGSFVEATFKTSGTIKLGVFINKGNHAFYAVDSETTNIIPAKAMTVEGYLNNNTWDGWKDEGGTPYDRPYHIALADTCIITTYSELVGGSTKAPGQPFLGYISFPVEAKTYYFMNPKSQLALYSYEFTPTPTPVEDEVWRASEITTNKDALAAMDSVINFSTANVSMKWVSSPYIDAIKEGKSPWSFKCNVKNNMAISDNDTVCIIGIGNPAIECREWWEWDADKQKDVAKKEETYFLPGCGKLPMRGSFVEATFKTSGTIKLGVFINKGNHAFYAVDSETTNIIPAKAMTVEGYLNNNTWDGWKDEGGTPYDRPYHIALADTCIITTYSELVGGSTKAPGQPFLGYISFPVEAKTYYFMNPKSQLALYSYTFTPGAVPTVIEDIVIERPAVEKKADNRMFNLQGVQVNENYRGIVIMNGKRYLKR
ncbi:MAG: hypothetical protein MJY52_01755 [Bacteroidaceae bacterium]|nr:hypothetical protein [Bacteroidaceae bacterium]